VASPLSEVSLPLSTPYSCYFLAPTCCFASLVRLWIHVLSGILIETSFTGIKPLSVLGLVDYIWSGSRQAWKDEFPGIQDELNRQVSLPPDQEESPGTRDQLNHQGDPRSGHSLLTFMGKHVVNFDAVFGDDIV
jgi:hypothetical protein